MVWGKKSADLAVTQVGRETMVTPHPIPLKNLSIGRARRQSQHLSTAKPPGECGTGPFASFSPSRRKILWSCRSPEDELE